MINIMLILSESHQRMMIHRFSHSFPHYTINFVNSKEISPNCRNTERKMSKSLLTSHSVIGGKNILWICDRDEDIDKLSKTYQGKDHLPVIAFSHEGNGKESLMGAPWLIETADGLTPELIEEVLARSQDLPLTIGHSRRCLIRELTDADLPGLLKLQEENRKNPGGRFFPENCAAPDYFLKDYIRYQYSFYGFGLFAVLVKDHPSRRKPGVAGIVGFSISDLSGADAEISYAFLQSYQGQGYAREAVEFILCEGKRRWQLEKIAARIRPEQGPSLRLARQFSIDIVLEKD